MFYYTKCPKNFHPIGKLCSPDCPNHMEDVGISCHKDIKTRDSSPFICTTEEELDVGLCYGKCEAPFTGQGGLCYEPCPKGLIECGSLCLSTTVNCSLYLVNLVGGGVSAVIDITTKALDETIKGTDIITDVKAVSSELEFPVCPMFVD